MKTFLKKNQDGRGVIVWDIPIRLYHWTQVFFVIVTGVTGFLASDHWLDVHSLAGYGLGGLLAFRILWGFWGGRYSRFSAFPLAWDDLRAHFRALLSGQTAMQAGHNPAGAWMIVIMLSLLGGLLISGIVVLGGQENQGPLAALISYRVGHALKEIHEALAVGLMWAIAGHLAGVFLETRLLGHSVAGAMLNGRKNVDPGLADPGGHLSWRGALLLVIVGGVLFSAGKSLAALSGGGWHAVQTPAVYSSNCGECHHAHHPSLRGAASWRRIMAGLDDHFGEHASLGESPRKAIAGYLRANAAETFDTEASNLIGRPETKTDRMTGTRAWIKRHKSIDGAVYRRKAVGSKVNCNACHTDAASGRYDDQAISIPGEDAK